MVLYFLDGRLESAYQRHYALAHAAHDARCALLHIALVLGALWRGWRSPYSMPGAAAVFLSVIIVHASSLVLQRRRELWLRLREPLFVVIHVAEAFALRYLSQAEVLRSLATTRSPALAFLAAVVLLGSGAVLNALLCCGLLVRLRFQIHVCVALLVVQQLLTPAFYKPALESNATLQRLAGAATVVGRRTAPRDACLALWRCELLAAFWGCVAARYRAELQSRKQFMRRAVFLSEPPGCSPRSLVDDFQMLWPVFAICSVLLTLFLGSS